MGGGSDSDAATEVLESYSRDQPTPVLRENLAQITLCRDEGTPLEHQEASKVRPQETQVGQVVALEDLGFPKELARTICGFMHGPGPKDWKLSKEHFWYAIPDEGIYQRFGRDLRREEEPKWAQLSIRHNHLKTWGEWMDSNVGRPTPIQLYEYNKSCGRRMYHQDADMILEWADGISDAAIKSYKDEALLCEERGCCDDNDDNSPSIKLPTVNFGGFYEVFEKHSCEACWYDENPPMAPGAPLGLYRTLSTYGSEELAHNLYH